MSRPLPEWTALGPGNEFDMIRQMARRWGSVARGAGDDGAVLDLPPGTHLVASTDTSLEGVHFRRAWLTDEEIGFRATAAALSDLAAMAADPIGLLVAATISPAARDTIDRLADGIGAAARETRCPIVGGDLSHGDLLCLTITVLGAASAPVRRRGAVPGNGLFVTGRLGGPGAAVRALETGQPVDPECRARFARPTPRLSEARWLADHGVTAMIDISDGLAADARHLAAASDVALEILLDRVPCLAPVAPTDAATSGEEYELLLSAPDELDSAAFALRFGIPLTRIGRVVQPGEGTVTFLAGGHRVDLRGGYDHFSG